MLIAILTAFQAPVAPRPVLLDDALFRIADVTGRVQRVRDCDGDGRDDLVMERGGEHYEFARIDLVSSKAGKLIRTLWHRADLPEHLADSDAKEEFLFEVLPAAWDARGDVDGDGVPDLVLGFPSAKGPGRIDVVSGQTGNKLYSIEGQHELDRLGASVAFLGDVDGDGLADFVCGVPETPVGWPLDGRQIDSFSDANAAATGSRQIIHFSDGSSEDQLAWTQARLTSRSVRAGHVSVRSGKDGHELSRIDGALAGLGFGSVVAAAGDIDRDGTTDFIAQCDERSTQPIRVFSGKTREPIRALPTYLGAASAAGDVDGDGTPDLILDAHGADDAQDRVGAAHFVSGKTGAQLYELEYPDLWSPYGVTVPVGDVDGDGVDDIAFGEPNYNLNGATGGPAPNPHAPDLAKLTLVQALALESDPWCAFTWESGYAIVYSSKSRRVIFGAWAPPGTRKGLGLAVTSMPDVNGDGQADILVTDSDTAYVFAGPPRAKK